ncbi:hypothetical protein [Nitratireductor aestuarii]|uniref:hypothetical protein n=1 Tax=Nitratireductor aestuarii TaxID=1735103 RepID=UPI00166A12A4|nr:hypothetical protein [Nitratireductor aestuarii]
MEGKTLRLLKNYSAQMCIACLFFLTGSTGVWAQNVVSPAVDWNGNYTFTSTADRNLRLLQADLIEKKEQGYYESLGKTSITQNVTNNTTTTIGQNTNAIGAVNNSTNNINLNGNNNNIDISNLADSTGCQDGSVNIGEGTSAIGSSGCQY